MKLTELFTGEKKIADTGKLQSNTVRNDAIGRQIRSMVPGQTIQGEVVSKSGSEVQIRVADDFVLQARLDQNMNLEIGKNMTFEVKNNGKALMLSPLFTNVATDANVLKALDMASLPINATTVSMTKQMMEAGLSIDKNSLQQVYREVNQFSQAELSDIVNLHKLQMPVNESNVSQMASYRNLTHQLVTGLNDVLEAVPEIFAHMMETGDTEGAVKLYQQLVLLTQETEDGRSVMGENTGDFSSADAAAGEDLTEEAILGTASKEGEAKDPSIAELPIAGQNAEKASGTENTAQSTMDGGKAKIVITENEESTAKTEKAVDQTGHRTPNAVDQTAVQDAKAAPAQQFANLLGRLSEAGMNEQEIMSQIRNLLKESGGNDILNPVMQLLKKQWTISPEEVADVDRVEGLYRRLEKQLKSLGETMENVGQTSSTAYKAVTNLSQNLDFMQQINQTYTYVQLPLRLQQGEAHGELYVYTNKKNLAMKDGKISALLHLDMEHLGPLDVYVAMMQENVSTKFYLQDDSMLDFLSGHMDILTQRLKKRGYQCSFEMRVREQQGEQKESGIKKLLQQENHIPLAEYAFDVRT